MAAIHYRTVWIVNIGLLLVAISVAQQSPTTPAPPETPGRQTPLYAISTAEVPDVSSLLISFPLVCTSDNTVLTRMGTPTGLDDLISISSNGRKVVQFRTDRINDINSPTPVTFFATEGEVYQVATGRGPENKNVEIHSPNGEVSRQLASTRKYWVTRFQNDGTYAGAIPLDLPFQPLQIGVFKSGDFLIAGVMPGTDEPKLALVKSNGQLNRYLNLEDDVHLREERSDSTGPQKKEDPRGLPKEGTNTLLHALMRSSIIADGNNLLLFRKGQQTPVYSVSAGGEVKEISLKIPEGYDLQVLTPTSNSWVALYIRRPSPGKPGAAYRAMALDRQTHDTIAEYTFPRLVGIAMACADDNTMSFLTRNDEGNKLLLVTVAAKRASKVTDPQ